MKGRLVFLGFLILGMGRGVAADGIDTNAVVAAVRGFLVGALTLDAVEVERHALPHPDLDRLSEGIPPPLPVKRQMRDEIGRSTCRFLEPGERVRLPGGKTVVVPENAVTLERCLVRPSIEGDPMPMPVPLAVVKTERGWKVDAVPLIAARKAGARSRGDGGR